MNFTRISAVVIRQLYLIRGSASRVLPMFVWVLVDMTLWGFMTRYLNSVSSPGFSFVPLFLGGVLLWDFFARVMQGVTTAFFEDVWSRNFLNVFGSPLTVSEYVTGLVLTSVLTSFIGLVAMLLLASGVFGLSFMVYGASLGVFLLSLFMFGISLGIFGCSMVLRWGPASEWFIWPIPAILSPFACVFYPLATLPAAMQMIAYCFPPVYVFETMRNSLQGQPPTTHALIMSIALSVVYLALSAYTFKTVYRHAVRTGLIARYSAETVS